MRPVMKMDALPAHPHVCIICGLGPGHNDRKFFVDLGFDIDVHFQPLYSGAVYVCDQCGMSLFNAMDAIFAEDYRLTNEQLGEFPEPTYSQFDEFGGSGDSDSGVSSSGSEQPSDTSSGTEVSLHGYSEGTEEEIPEDVPEIWAELSGDSVRTHGNVGTETTSESVSPDGIPDDSLRSAESLGVDEPANVSDSATNESLEIPVQFSLGDSDRTSDSS